MTATTLEAVLRRDRLIVAGTLVLMTALAWAYLIWLAARMHAAHGVMAMEAMVGPRTPWTLGDFAFMAAMWAVMMVGMMVPSATPMILLYARVGRQAAAQSRPFASAGWFAAGYLLAWTGFAIGAAVAQWGAEGVLSASLSMTGMRGVVGGCVLIAAGLYQWTRLKDRCLSHCQAPLLFIQRHGGFRPDALGALRLGARHGLYCIGCCAALMALLFVGGIMNLLWVAGLAAVVLVEKLAPRNLRLPQLVGTALVAAGAWMLIGGLSPSG